jgi:hypothetical protein
MRECTCNLHRSTQVYCTCHWPVPAKAWPMDGWQGELALRSCSFSWRSFSASSGAAAATTACVEGWHEPHSDLAQHPHAPLSRQTVAARQDTQELTPARLILPMQRAVSGYGANDTPLQCCPATGKRARQPPDAPAAFALRHRAAGVERCAAAAGCCEALCLHGVKQGLDQCGCNEGWCSTCSVSRAARLLCPSGQPPS